MRVKIAVAQRATINERRSAEAATAGQNKKRSAHKRRVATLHTSPSLTHHEVDDESVLVVFEHFLLFIVIVEHYNFFSACWLGILSRNVVC